MDEHTNHKNNYNSIKDNIFQIGRPSYISDKSLRDLANLTHLLFLLIIPYNNDKILFYISIVYIINDFLWHNIKNSKNIISLKIVHTLSVVSLFIYVILKSIIAYNNTKNINIILPLIVFILIENYKGGSKDKLYSKIYKNHMIYEPFIHTFLWIGLYFIITKFPEFNITFEQFLKQLKNIMNNFLY